MKLSNLSVIFIIIIIPIILVFSYYISLQVETINMQTSYNTKLLDSTKEAIEAFEINTVEWNNAYNKTADSKRRDIMASVNTFITSFSNSLGISGANREDILTYIPAIACTLYDGYYIYSPAETKEVIKDENGVAVFMSDDLAKGKKSGKIASYSYTAADDGKILYEANGNSQSTYTNSKEVTKNFTLDPDDAKPTYSHILKPFASYSARYKNKSGDIDVVINYTLDNYITVYGKVKGNNVIKSGYLININNLAIPSKENLNEKVWYEGAELETIGIDDDGNEIKKLKKEFPYIYADDNTKVYFDGDTPFQVSATGERTNLSEASQKYKKIVKEDGTTIYQALSNYDINHDGEINEEDIISGNYYTEKGNPGQADNPPSIDIKEDVSARNYYYESVEFSNWVSSNLSSITINDMQNVDDKSIYGDVNSKIFNVSDSNNPEDEGSIFNMHKREVIRQSLISNLNQAITSYSRKSPGDYQLPILTETDWDHIFRNVSIITFVQNMPIGMKYYNNYAVATSTSNKEYVNPDGIYLSGDGDEYYHMPYCDKLFGNKIIGYRNTDYALRSYEVNDKIKYYYRHENLANQECYYCLVQRDLYDPATTKEKDENRYTDLKKVYDTALARERYVSHEFR